MSEFRIESGWLVREGDVIERNRAALDEEIREAHTIARRRESQ